MASTVSRAWVTNRFYSLSHSRQTCLIFFLSFFFPLHHFTSGELLRATWHLRATGSSVMLASFFSFLFFLPQSCCNRYITLLLKLCIYTYSFYFSILVLASFYISDIHNHLYNCFASFLRIIFFHNFFLFKFICDKVFREMLII
jgi:hypothetical protein